MTNPPTDGSSALNEPASPARRSQHSAPRLVTLAILKANWNDGRSYLDNFTPFVVECLRAAPGPVTLVQIQSGLRKTFGMKVPQNTLKTILRRAARDELVHLEDHRYVPNQEKLTGASGAPAQGDFLRCYQALVDQLQAFATRRFSRDFSAAEAAAALDAYVDENGAPIVLRSAAPDLEFAPKVVTASGTGYIVHAFVEELAAKDPAGFGYLETVVEGSMLASVLYLPDAGAVQRKFRDSTVYLDTPFLLCALGYQGAELAAPAVELLELLRDHGAGVACFDSTLSELRGVLLSAAREVGTRRPRWAYDILHHFAKMNYKRADIDLLAASLEKDLQRLGVRVLPAPPFGVSSTIDEAAFEQVLRECVGYQSDNTLQHDLAAVAAVHRLRGERSQSILEDSKAIFVTTNPQLVRAVRKYFGRDDQGFSWPPAILDSDLATLVWLKKPMERPDFPRKQIMADCYANLRPSSKLWSAWLDEIERTDQAGTYSEEQLELIRYSPEAQRTLMDLTMGEASAVDSRTVEQALESAVAAVLRPHQEELSATRQALEAVEAQLAAEQQRRTAAEEERLAAEAALAQHAEGPSAEEAARVAVDAALAEQRAAFRTRCERRATRDARRIGTLIFAGLCVVVVVAAVLAFAGVSGIPGPVVPWPLRAVAALIGVAGVGLSIKTTLLGGDARAIAKWVEAKVEPHLVRRYLHQAGHIE